MKEVTLDNHKFLLPSWDEMDGICFQLAKKIIAAGEKYDRLVTIIKGGLAFSRSMADYLQIPNLSTFQIKYYNNINGTNEKPEIIQSLPAEIDIKDENILLFDEIIDSGETLKLALNYLKSKSPKKITLVSLFLKPRSIIKPDFYGYETDVWVIFPNEIRETIEFLSKKWQTEKINHGEITNRLLSLGISSIQIKSFLKP